MDKIEEIVKKIAGQDVAENRTIEKSEQLVVFILDGREYAVEITSLLEIIRIPLITPLPVTTKAIAGVFNLRGKIIVVFDPIKRFEIVRQSEEKAVNILVIEAGNNTFGVLVDGVKGIINVPLSTIDRTEVLPDHKIDSAYIAGGVVVHPTRLIVLLDLPKILSELSLEPFG